MKISDDSPRNVPSKMTPIQIVSEPVIGASELADDKGRASSFERLDDQAPEGGEQMAHHVLCVDDEPDILSVARLSLEKVGGYRVSTCSSGVEALDRVDEIRPDIILLDVMMPQMSGPETFRKLNERGNALTIPVIFMTARVQPQEVTEYFDLGATAVVHKPFDPMQLAVQVGEVLENFQAR